MLEVEISYDPPNRRINIICPYELKDICKIHGARWDKIGRVWYCPATPNAARLIINAFKLYCPKISPQVLDLDAGNDSVEIIKHHPEQLAPIDHTAQKPWLHQLQGYHLINLLPATMLAFDMGTGKTKVIVDVVQNNPEIKRTLVLCPKSVVSVWPKEFLKHSTKTIQVAPLEDDKVKDRAKHLNLLLATPYQLVAILNYDSIYREIMLKVLLSLEWDCIVLDESHKIKSPGGKISRTCTKLRAKKRVCLTGTPMPHSPLDIFAQYRFLDTSIFGPTFTGFKNKYAIMGGYLNKEVKGYRDTDELHHKFYSIAMRVKKDDVLDLPAVINETRLIKLSQEEQKAYKTMENDFIIQLETRIVTASNALSKLMRLQQITSGYTGTETGDELRIGTSKQTALSDLIDDIDSTEPIVVFARFHHDLDVIKEVAAALGRKCLELSGRKNELLDWQLDNSGSIIAVQIQAGGLGVDLTRARYCIYYSLSWSLGEHEQSLARIHRPGQKYHVLYLYLLCQNTIDERMYAALRDKKEVIESVLSSYEKRSN